MKKSLILLVSLLGLAGCKNNKNSGVIDCYDIQIRQGNLSVLSRRYAVLSEKIYEYQNNKKEKIYTKQNFKNSDDLDVTIRLYSNGIANEYVVYSYVRFVGYIIAENNYYLDLEKRVIDEEEKRTQAEKAFNPDNMDSFNNQEAYKCVKSNMYFTGVSSFYGVNDYLDIYLDSEETSLDRHSYTVVGEDCSILYTAKWF